MPTSDAFDYARTIVQPKIRRMSNLPAEINPTMLSVSGTSPGPVAVSPTASLPTITSPAAAVPKARVPSRLGPSPSPSNYGNLYGVNSPYHYNDILIDGSEYTNFPQSATGMLWISQDGVNWGWCSASLIGRNIGVAAGHCVRENHTWIRYGLYIPACIGCGRFDGNVGAVYAPFGYAWLWFIGTTAGWANNEAIDQGYDISVFVTGPLVNNSNFPGDYTGWNSFCYLNCLQPDWMLRQTGFPFDYAGGNWMFEGQHLAVSDTRDYVVGSGAGPGSSGGPWVANAGLYPAYLYDSSSDKGQWPYGNAVFATTSWGYSAANNTSYSYKIQGGSSLSGVNNSNDGSGTGFKGMYNFACNKSRSLFGTSLCTPL